MKSKMKLSLLACALSAMSVAGAQVTNGSNDVPPPNDIIRLPGSVTTPGMPIVVTPPRDDIGRRTTAPINGGSREVQPVIRSLGSDASTSDSTMTNSISGGGTPSSNGAGAAAPVAGQGTRSVNGAVNGTTSSAGSGGPTDIGGINGAKSSAGLNGGITPSSGGKAGIFGTSKSPEGTDTTGNGSGNANGQNGNADTGSNALTGGTLSGGQGTAPGAPSTAPAGRTGGAISNGAGSKGASGK